MQDEAAVERRLEREARERFLGTLGDPNGVNVARVEVSWWYEDPGLGMHELTRLEQHAGHFRVHAPSGEGRGADYDIYEVFTDLTTEAMEQRRGQRTSRVCGWTDWQIDDISSW